MILVFWKFKENLGCTQQEVLIVVRHVLRGLGNDQNPIAWNWRKLNLWCPSSLKKDESKLISMIYLIGNCIWDTL
jgi:hypothetical protein